MLLSEDEVQKRLTAFMEEREWSQFHTPENLAKSISIESGELLEHYQWNSASDINDVKMELADVLTYAYLLAQRIGVSPHEIIIEKLAITAEKYPVIESKGNTTKYDQRSSDAGEGSQ